MKPLASLAVLLAAALSGHAQEITPYEYRATANPHGTGKFFLGREIAKVAPTTEWPNEQKQWQARGLLEQLVRRGDHVADVGAGSGYVSFLLSDLLGGTGMVYAVDVDNQSLAAIRRRVEETRRGNVTAILGQEADPRLPEGRLDLILVIHAYHEFSHPYEMTRAMVRALRPDGRLVFVEARQEELRGAYDRQHAMSRGQMLREMQAFDLTPEYTPELTLPERHVLVFRKTPGTAVALDRINRQALYPPNAPENRPNGQPMRQEVRKRMTGRLVFVNTYDQPVTIRLNGGEPFLLFPRGQVIYDDHPAGVFTYEVVGIRPPRTQVLVEGETFTVQVYNR